MFMDPTAMTPGADAGLSLAASSPSLPAAAMTWMPAAMAAVAAESMAADLAPPMDMVRTEGFLDAWAAWMLKSMPAMMSLEAPEPDESAQRER